MVQKTGAAVVRREHPLEFIRQWRVALIEVPDQDNPLLFGGPQEFVESLPQVLKFFGSHTGEDNSAAQNYHSNWVPTDVSR